MASGGKISIKVESETSELQLQVKETDKVENLIKIIKRAWDDGDDYITLHHQGTEMRGDQPLSTYNVIHGSVIKLKVRADSP